MQLEVIRSPGQLGNSIALARIQNAVEMNRPCIIVSPPGFGQNQMIAHVANALARKSHKVTLNDDQLTDPSYIRDIISSIQKCTDNEQVVLYIEHQFNTSSLTRLKEAKKSYADAIRLNRIDNVLPILCTPFSNTLFESPKSNTQQGSLPEWLIVQTHELYISTPIGTTQLLNSAPPHLHQSLLGVTRLAECWPEMGALLNAKLKGLGAQQEFRQNNASNQDELTLSPNATELQIPSQALKTTCSELLNNYQSLMNTLADKLLSHTEQMLIAHLSLFPPNIHPYLPMIEQDIPHLTEIIQALCLKNILTLRIEESPQGRQQLLSFSNLAWRFFAQGHLRRSCSSISLNNYALQMIELIQSQGGAKHKEYCCTLAIEFCLSARYYEQAIELIVQQAQSQADSGVSKLARIEQAVAWFKFVPQRLVNLNSQARVIQSYHRLVVEQSTSATHSVSLGNKAKRSHKQESDLLHHIRDSQQPSASTQTQKKLKPRLQQSGSIDVKDAHQSDLIVSLNQVELPKNGIRATQASLLLDIQQHIENQNISQVKTLAELMIDQSLNQQKPELFLHGLIYLWYQCQLTDGLLAFRTVVENLLSDERVSTHLNEFRYWLNQIYSYAYVELQPALHRTDNSTLDITQASNNGDQIDLPSMPHLSSLGQNLLGFMTSYFNSIIALSRCKPHIVSERVQEATYHAMNLPDSFSQTIMPLWLIEVYNFLQQNKLQQALTYIRNTTRNNKLGTQKIQNPLLNTFEYLADQLSQEEPQEYLLEQLPPKDLANAYTMSKQIQAIALIWQHSYKKSARQTTKLLESISFDAVPWLWFGPTSWYLLTNSQDNSDGKSSQKTEIELQLNTIEYYYAGSYNFDQSYLSLSKRETEILGLVVNGCSNEEISNLLCRSLGTIKLHVHSIYKKLGVSNRVNAIKKCQVSGFFGFGFGL